MTEPGRRAWNPGLPSVYDRVAEPYARQFFDELDRKPFDRERLGRFAAQVAGRGPVCDLGCGPGHVGRYVGQRGVCAVGLDLSAGMLAEARRLSPEMAFVQGDLRALPLAAGSLAGAVAFYSLIHLERAEAPRALGEIFRVLRPGGRALVAVHGGAGEVHADDWFGRGVSVDATLFEPGELAMQMTEAGFRLEDVTARDPYPFEYPTQRVYLSGSKP